VLTVVFLALIGAATATQGPTASSGIPDSFRSENTYRVPPLWVSAASALDSQREVRSGVMEDRELRMVQGQVNAARERARVSAMASTAGRVPDECDVRFAPPVDSIRDFVPPRNFSELAAQAANHAVIDGVVTDVAVGFYGAIPATVVKVLTKGNRPQYLLLMTGRITVSGMNVCSYATGFSTVPAIGDHAIAVVGSAADDTATLYPVPGERLFVERAGHLFTPPNLGDSNSSGLKSLEDVRQTLAAGKHDHKE